MTKSAALPYKTVLVIDASERDQTSIALSFMESGSDIVSTKARAQELPKLIEDLLNKHKILPAEIGALALVKKPGSVTASRIGTAVVNTLAWLGRKHVIEVAADDIAYAVEKLRLGKYDRVVKISLPVS